MAAPDPLWEAPDRAQTVPIILEEVSSTSQFIAVLGDGARVRHIPWDAFTSVQYFRTGTGTTLFSATYNDTLGTTHEVVIKTPLWPQEECEFEEATQDLRREAEILGRLSHPHIIKLFGVGSLPLRDGSSAFFLATARLDGGVLSERLKTTPPLGQPGAKSRATFEAQQAMASLARVGGASKGPPPPSTQWGKHLSYPDVLECAEHLAEALAYLNDTADPESVILHRDLKPDNIGFLGDGSVQIFDFGLHTSVPRRCPLPPPPAKGGDGEGKSAEGKRGEEKEAEAEVRLPRFRLTGQTGSVRYMAPEVALDEPYNQSVDVYSFSMVLWEMVHRRKPYSGMDVERHRREVCVGGVRPALDPKLTPPDLGELLAKGWHKDPDQRPDFREVAAYLRQMRSDVSRAASSTEGPRKGLTPRRFLSFGKAANSSWF